MYRFQMNIKSCKDWTFSNKKQRYNKGKDIVRTIKNCINPKRSNVAIKREDSCIKTREKSKIQQTDSKVVSNENILQIPTIIAEKLNHIARINDAVMSGDVNYCKSSQRVYNGPVPRISTPVYNGKFMRRKEEKSKARSQIWMADRKTNCFRVTQPWIQYGHIGIPSWVVHTIWNILIRSIRSVNWNNVT